MVSKNSCEKSNLVLRYNLKLKPLSRRLRTKMTESEQLLWSRLRRKQILGIQLYRQKPIGNYIVDFYAPRAKLIVEVDGSQHFDVQHAIEDKQRDAYLNDQGLRVLRFNNLQVLQQIDAVVDVIYQSIEDQVGKQ